MKAGKMLKWLSLALSCVFILNYGAIADQTRVNYSRTESDQIETLVNSLNLKEKIGQMMVVGFPESYSDSLPVGIKEVIDNLKPGGIILFARNTRNPMMMQKLAGALQEASRNSSTIPLFLMADQEGGIVMQVSEKTTVFPGQMAIGATGSSKLAEESAGIMGIEALAMGLNVIYGPVLDVNTEPDNEVIGIRSLGEDSTRVSVLGNAMLRGFEKSGIIACAKHFPGHGSTKTDSHRDLPVRRVTMAELEKTDLAPFRSAIANGVPMIMTAHISYPLIASRGLPATLSGEILTGLLRRKMSFNGVIVTDCLEMDAIKEYYGVAPAAVAAVKAGTDMILVSRTRELQKEAVIAIYNAVQNGEITESHIDQSLRRILNLKLTRLKKATGKNIPLEIVGSSAHLQVEQEMARKAVTLVRNENNILPLQPGRLKKLVLVYPKCLPVLRNTEQGPVNILTEAISSYWPNLLEVRFERLVTSKDISAAVTAAKQGDAVVVLTLTKTRDQERAQGKLVKRLLRTGKPVVAVAARSPYDLRAYPKVKAYLATYGYQPCSLSAMAEILFGEIHPSGKLPVSITGLYNKGHGLEGF